LTIEARRAQGGDAREAWVEKYRTSTAGVIRPGIAGLPQDRPPSPLSSTNIPGVRPRAQDVAVRVYNRWW
jgi:hypothetical protein